MFDSLIKVYAQTIEEIKKTLFRGNEKEPLLKLFEAEIMACETPEDLLAWVENWYNLYLKRADYCVLDAAMDARIADSLEDDRPLCLVMGEAHAEMIAKDLTTGPLGVSSWMRQVRSVNYHF